MNALQQWCQGRKTYLTCLAVGALLFGSWQKWWQLPPEVYAGLVALATAFLRAGIAKAGGGSLAPPPGESGGGGGLAPLKSLMLWVVAALAAGGLLGVALVGCGTLDPSGPYKGDKVLYSTDLSLATSYDVLHGFVQWEWQNRAALASIPGLHAAADSVRGEAPGWFGRALALRDAYQGDPSAANRAALDKGLAVLEAAVSQAVAWMATNSVAPALGAPVTLTVTNGGK